MSIHSLKAASTPAANAPPTSNSSSRSTRLRFVASSSPSPIPFHPYIPSLSLNPLPHLPSFSTPQTSSRKSASLWLCHLHNLVNIRLLKPQFDCLTLDATYDCGCAEEPTASSSTTVSGLKKNGDAGKGGGKGRVEGGKDGLTGVEMMKGGR